MTSVLAVPKDDRFLVVNEVSDEFVVDPGYLGIQRSRDCIVIQITLNADHKVEAKRAFYKAAADGLHERLGLRREDVFINSSRCPERTGRSGMGRSSTRCRGERAWRGSHTRSCPKAEVGQVTSVFRRRPVAH